MNKEEFSLDIDMSKADMSKLKDLLTSKLGLRHFAFQLKTGEYLDLVEYKDYEKLEKELEQLKEIEKEHQKINGELRVENKELKKQLEEANLELQLLDMRTDENIKYKNQQKKFIEYLENEIKERKIQILGYHPTTQLLIEQIIETEKMVLSKYKEIIGGKE